MPLAVVVFGGNAFAGRRGRLTMTGMSIRRICVGGLSPASGPGDGGASRVAGGGDSAPGFFSSRRFSIPCETRPSEGWQGACGTLQQPPWRHGYGAHEHKAGCLLLAGTTTAQAGTEDSIGVAPEDIALGGSAAARPGTYAACYYNPAGLSPGGSVPGDEPGFAELTLGFTYASPLVYAQRLDDGTTLPLAAQPADTAGVTLGSRFDLGHHFGVDGLNVGLSFYVPTNGIFFWSIQSDQA